MSQESVEIVRRFLDATNRGDREAVAALIHPQVEWHTMASALLGVEMVRGRDETVSFIFEQIPEGIESFTAIADHVRELPGDRVLSIGRYGGRGTSSGAKIEVNTASVYRFDSGMIVFFRDFPSEAEALKAVGLEE
jgi:ketosteroid isomerase-like protein